MRTRDRIRNEAAATRALNAAVAKAVPLIKAGDRDAAVQAMTSAGETAELLMEAS